MSIDVARGVAQSFVQTLVNEHKVAEVEREPLIRQLTEAMHLDANSPTTLPGGRYGALADSLNARDYGHADRFATASGRDLAADGYQEGLRFANYMNGGRPDGPSRAAGAGPRIAPTDELEVAIDRQTAGYLKAVQGRRNRA